MKNQLRVRELWWLKQIILFFVLMAKVNNRDSNKIQNKTPGLRCILAFLINELRAVLL